MTGEVIWTLGDLAAELARLSAETDGRIGFSLSCSRDHKPAWCLEIFEGETSLLRKYGASARMLVSDAAAYLSDYQPGAEWEANRR